MASENMVQMRITKVLFNSFCGATAVPDNGTVLLTLPFNTAAQLNTALSAALRGQVYTKKKAKPSK